LFLRAASKINDQVTDIPLISYMRKFQNAPSVLGIALYTAK